MANYHYDEAGNMALYFLITFLSLTLLPWTISGLRTSRKREVSEDCQCTPCVERRKATRKRESSVLPKFSRKNFIKVVGWGIFAAAVYQASTVQLEQKMYDPFEILGIRHGMIEKEIKSHYKKLSRKFHPDKVRLAENQTMEEVEAHFVEITKAYKALTDDEIRSNWEQYGHPDGRQEVSMGIAIPEWVVKGENNIYVLGLYGLLFGGALPILVSRWWSGNRGVTKEGVDPRSAAAYFKSVKEDSSLDDIVSTLGKAVEFETDEKKPAVPLGEVEAAVQTHLGEARWQAVRREVGENRTRALVLLFAHLLRVPLSDPALQKEQLTLILRTPTLLNSLLTTILARNWLTPSLAAMRLHAYLAQALQPGVDTYKFAQLPDVSFEDSETLGKGLKRLEEFSAALEKVNDPRLAEIRKAQAKWGRLEVLEHGFKVIGERSFTPQCIVYLVVKLRITPPSATKVKEPKPVTDKEEEEFLVSSKDSDPLTPDQKLLGAAHAPYWPTDRKPTWWLVLGDEKTNRVVVPPVKITGVPVADISSEGPDYRRYKLQFQAPPGIGMYTWKIYLISDTFVGGDIISPIVLKIEEPTVAAEAEDEDDISEPEEDSLAGQMALMRGGSVKKIGDGEDSDEDEESGTDDDKKKDESDSDSDSD